SEIPEGNHWQKVIGQEAIKALGDQDYCGVLHFTGRDEWLWRSMLKVGPNRAKMLALLDRMIPGHATIRSRDGAGQHRIRQAEGRGGQAYDHHQRRRSIAPQSGHGYESEKHGRQSE